MKNKIIITAILALLATSIFAQQKASPEEAAVKKVIEDETKYFMQRDYDKWATCVAHDPMTYFTWTTPFAGEHSVFEAKGWDAVSKAFKNFMEEWPVDNDTPKKENYKFRINSNMAYVTFTQDGRSEGTRVLEKKNGQWRILRMEALATTAFAKMHKLYALQRLAGNWEVDMTTHKKEGGGDWKLQGGNMNMERTPTGLIAKEKYNYLDENGDPRTSEVYMMYSLDMGTGKIGILSSSHYPNSNWMTSHSSTGDIDENGALVCEGKKVGKEDDNVGSWTMRLEGENLFWSVDVKDKDGKQVYASSCNYRNADMITASKQVKP